MTLAEYDTQFDHLLNKWRTTQSPHAYQDMIDLQYTFLGQIRDEIYDQIKTVNGIKKRVLFTVLEIFNRLKFSSVSGHVMENVGMGEKNPEEFAREVKDYLNKVYGDMFSEEIEIYPDKNGEEWVVDCMFGGKYCPEWDGFLEEVR